MKNYRLSIITENQNHPRKAENVAGLIKRELGLYSDPVITRYEKFANSYKILFSGHLDSGTDFISEAIELSDRLASPWLVYYDRTTGSIELIFNKSPSCRYGRNEFNVVCWANMDLL